jgi:peptidoglycan hydrolase-like protein with peptidoglycan-binding domain
MALESGLFIEEGPGKKILAACASSRASGRQPPNIYLGRPQVPGLDDAVARIQQALEKIGFPIKDPKGVFGQSTADAILEYKSNESHPILAPGQKTADNIIGPRTIHQLDQDFLFEPRKLEFGSTNWRYTFFGNTGPIGRDVFTLFISSLDGQDSQNFDIETTLVDRGLTTGFKGEARGTFDTPRKALVKEFKAASCQVMLSKVAFFNDGVMSGIISLGTIGADDRRFNALLQVRSLQDTSLGSSLTGGLFQLHGSLRTSS